jgi:macrolide-specific efflux system membrane fusion protein
MPTLVRTHPRATGVVVVLVLAAAGAGAYLSLRDAGSADAQQATTSIQTVSTGTIRQSVSATGALAPAKEEELNFGASGQVTHVDVKAGQHVKKGQALAKIDSATLKSTVAQAKSSVASARAKVDDDETNDATDTQLSADEAALKAAKNQRASAKSQLRDATLRSPIAGAVAEVNLTRGQTVSGSSSGTGNTGAQGGSDSSGSSAQVLVISTDKWIVNATVDASSVGQLKKGDQAQLTATGATQTVYGTIESIGLVSSSTSGTASYPVVVDVTGAQKGLHDGASVTATLIYKQLSNVLVVAQTALHRNSNGGTYVEQVVNGKTVNTNVQTGLSSGGQVQIKSGLSSGAQIVVPVFQRATGSSTAGTTRTGTFPGGGTLPGGGAFPGGANFPGGGGNFPVLNNGGGG